MQQSNPSSYDFILNPAPPPRRPLFAGKSMKQRIFFVAIAALIVIILATVIMSFLGRGDKTQNQRLLSLAQTQTEIIRLTSVASGKATEVSTRTIAATTRLTTESAQRSILDALAARGVEVKPELLVLGKNTKSDELLNQAITNNRFDETYKSILTEQLNNYQKLLDQTYGSGSLSERTAIQSAANSTVLIAKSYQEKS